ncbi:MAG TPA: metallopeptidase TldD-related protein, partial [Candidatus Nitrosotenuis sp.]|nr:metallopeptidase TldD-related protein [Candidatus Nitrosotenuis sp.]
MKPPLGKLMSLALRRCRDAEVVFEERVEASLDGSEPRQARGWGVRVNHEGHLGFAWGSLDEPAESLLARAIAQAQSRQTPGILFSHGMAHAPPPPPLPPLDPGPALHRLLRLARRVEFLLPSVTGGRSFTLAGGLLLQRMTLVNRAGERTAQRTFHALAARCSRQPPLSALLVCGQLPESPAEMLSALAWRSAHSDSVADSAPTGPQPALWTTAAVAALLRDLAAQRLDARALRQGGLPPPPEGPWLSEKVSLDDDPGSPEGPGSAPFDGEALPRRRQSLLEGGRLRQLLADRLEASLLGLAAPGLAVRDWGEPPRPGYSNLVLHPGQSSLGDMARELGDGVLLDRLVPCRRPGPAGEFC